MSEDSEYTPTDVAEIELERAKDITSLGQRLLNLLNRKHKQLNQSEIGEIGQLLKIKESKDAPETPWNTNS